MLKNLRKHIGPMILIIVLFFCGTSNLVTVLAVDSTSGTKKSSTVSESTSKEDGANKVVFSVEAILPETQIGDQFTFFYVGVKPEEKQLLKVKVNNLQEEPIVVIPSVNDATTNVSGELEYSQKKVELDESMKYPLTSIVKPKEKEIKLGKFEEKIIEFEVTPPKDKFEGVRLGALLFNLKNDDTQKGMTSSYGYKIGIMLNEELKPYNVGGTLNSKGAKMSLYNGQKVVEATLQNPTPYVLQNVKMTTELRKKGSSEVLASNSLVNMSIAPNISFPFLTYLGLEPVKPGKYELKIVASGDSENWEWTEEFEVKQNQADKLNKDAVYKFVLPPVYKIGGIILSILTVINLGYLIIRRNKK